MYRRDYAIRSSAPRVNSPAAVAYTWCPRLVDLGAGDVRNGLRARIVAEIGPLIDSLRFPLKP
jgi:hypothetical protein